MQRCKLWLSNPPAWNLLVQCVYKLELMLKAQSWDGWCPPRGAGAELPWPQQQAEAQSELGSRHTYATTGCSRQPAGGLHGRTASSQCCCVSSQCGSVNLYPNVLPLKPLWMWNPEFGTRAVMVCCDLCWGHFENQTALCRIAFHWMSSKLSILDTRSELIPIFLFMLKMLGGDNWAGLAQFEF